MNIGDVVAMTGFSAKMIRHYEINGLMRTPGRTKRGYRTYSHDDVHRLQFIQCARELGLTCQEVRDLLLLWDDRKRSKTEEHCARLRRPVRGKIYASGRYDRHAKQLCGRQSTAIGYARTHQTPRRHYIVFLVGHYCALRAATQARTCSISRS